jgi:glycosyltransferase involved in cell wall biosynthesis
MHLTIGMACCHDFNGVFFTLMDLHRSRITAGMLDQVELLVIDNEPHGPSGPSAHSRETKDVVGQLRNARYIHAPNPQGTAPPRNQVFQEAQGDAVCCLDSHVLLGPEVFIRLVQFWTGDESESRELGVDNLYQGPCLNYTQQNHDGLPSFAGTHWAERWGPDGMFGQWEVNEVARLPDAKPFPISMCGLGLFTARRDSWLGFHEQMREFGGEEGYIHEKYRANGRQVYCLPWLQWIHRFGHVDGIKYPTNWKSRARNYLLSYRELGFPSYDSIKANLNVFDAAHNHWRVSNEQWADLVAELQITPDLPRRTMAAEVQQQSTVEAQTVRPCAHRSSEPTGELKCDLCGMRGQPFDVYDCQRFGLVSLTRKHSDVRSCLLCQASSEDEGGVALASLQTGLVKE